MGALDFMRGIAWTFSMSGSKPRARIVAEVLIEGYAEDVLADVRRLRGGRRTVNLSVTPPNRSGTGHSILDEYRLPAIKGGNIREALEKLELLNKQARISVDDDQRVARLIEEFGDFTK
jgi:hypothetical protein